MSYFADEKKMYIPLSIDTVEAERSNYFFSNQKAVIAFVMLIPLFIFLYPLMNGGASLLSILIVVVIYAFVYLYAARFVLFEELRLRKMIRELDKNKVSEVDHIWGIDKIGNGPTDDGIIYYAYKGDARGTTKGLIIKLERGSTVGVPKGHYKKYRKTKEQFLRKLHQSDFDFEWYEIQKKPELQESLVEYAKILTNVENEYHQKLLKLQLNINSLYSMDNKQRYVEYIVVKRTNFNRNFRMLLESIVEETFGQNGYFINPTVLGKRGVEEFYKTYLMQDMLDSDNIRKSVDIEPFENFAKVHRLIDAKGQEVPIQFLDDLDIEVSRGRSLEDNLKREERRKQAREKVRESQYKLAIEKLNTRRNKDALSHQEYLEEKERIDHMYDPEHYNPEMERERIQKEKEAERQARLKQREEALERARNPKYKVREIDLNDTIQPNITAGDESLDDLMENINRAGQQGQVEDTEVNPFAELDALQEEQTTNEDGEKSLDELMREMNK